MVWCHVASNVAALKASSAYLDLATRMRDPLLLIPAWPSLWSYHLPSGISQRPPPPTDHGKLSEEHKKNIPRARNLPTRRTCSVGVDRATASERTKIILGGVESRTQTPAVKPPAGLEASENPPNISFWDSEPSSFGDLYTLPSSWHCRLPSRHSPCLARSELLRILKQRLEKGTVLAHEVWTCHAPTIQGIVFCPTVHVVAHRLFQSCIVQSIQASVGDAGHFDGSNTWTGSLVPPDSLNER